jgi:hypothetical protein
MFPSHGAIWLHVHQQLLQVDYKESCPYQPMYLQLVSKSTIFVTINAITLCGTMVKTTCNHICDWLATTCGLDENGNETYVSYHLQLMVFNIKWKFNYFCDQ